MPGFWRKCRIAFRCVRFGVWLLVLVLAGVFLWCNRVGLPDFIKSRIVGTLHERGVELEFSRMRLSLVRGLVADNVHAGAAQTLEGAALDAREVRLQLNFPALCRFRWQVDGLVMSDGCFSLPLSPTNVLTLTNLQTELRFGEGDTWSLDHFRARFAGAQIGISGELAHAAEASHWQMFNGAGTDRSALVASLKNFSEALKRIHFQGEPQLRLTVSGDARKVQSLTARLEVVAAGVRTPWFSARNFQGAARLTAPVDAPTGTDPAWGFWTNLQPFRIAWSLRLGQLQVKQVNADTLACAGVWAAPGLVVTNLSARMGGGEFQAGARLDVSTRQLTFTNASSFDLRMLAPLLPEILRKPLAEITSAKPPALRVDGSLQLPAWTNPPDAGSNADAPALNVRAELNGDKLALHGVPVDRLETRFGCSGSIWNVDDLTLSQGWTQLQLSGQGNMATKQFQGRVSGRLDAASVRPFLAPGNGISQFSMLTTNDLVTLAVAVGGNWETLADLTATGRVTQGQTELQLSGQANAVTKHFQSSVSGPFDLASLRPFLKTNNVMHQVAALTATDPMILTLGVGGNWETLADLTATGRVAQGRTELQVSGLGNAATRNFEGLVSGRVDPAIVRPLLTTSDAVDGFAVLTANEPLVLGLDVRGNWQRLDSVTATGSVALTNFAVRGQTIDSVAGRLNYADGMVQLLDPELRRAQGTQWMTASAVVLDFKTLVLSFTNGFSYMDPTVMTAAIGPKTAELIEPYHFLKTPTARVNGCLPLRNMHGPQDTAGTDLRFDIIENVPFQWLKLTSTNLMGTIHWLGPELILTNVMGEFYGGTAAGGAYFDFRPAHEGADYRFSLAVTNVNLHLFAVGMSSPTNKLEGTVAGLLMVTSADTRNLESWNGYGTIKLHDGLLWDYPIIGILSPILNTFSAGLGNSRATEAAASFGITNGVIYTDSLKIHSTLMRLSYTGTVDMEQNVKARVTAHLFRDIWVVGPLVSTLLWPVSKVFECEVTGTLDQPKATPILLPAKLLLVPLHPISSLKELFTPSGSTNAVSPPPGK